MWGAQNEQPLAIRFSAAKALERLCQNLAPEITAPHAEQILQLLIAMAQDANGEGAILMMILRAFIAAFTVGACPGLGYVTNGVW